MELGGNILLEGFDSRDFTEMIVVKKIVGQYARRLADERGLEKLGIALEESGGKASIAVKATAKGKTVESEASAHNLYVALDQALKGILDKL